MQNEKNITPARLTVFYDGACPLCVKEIAFYRRRKGADRIAWLDVSNASASPGRGLSRCDALMRFHVMDANGDYFSGGDAFARLWATLPSFQFLGHAAQTQPFKWLINTAYNGFLPIRPYLQAFARLLGGSRRDTHEQG